MKEESVDSDNVATFVIDTNNWKQPQTEEEIVKITTFIASIATQTLLKSQKNGVNKFDVLVYMEKFKVGNLNYKFVKYLAEILKSLIPDTAGVIVRTAAEGVSEEELQGNGKR